MQFKPAKPSSRHWKAIASHPDAKWYLGEKLNAALWFIIKEKACIGVVGAEKHAESPSWLVCQLYLLPEFRHKHAIKPIYADCAKHLMEQGANGLIAEVETSRTGRAYSSMGWKKYCQYGEVSYYLLTREDLMRDKPL